MADVVDVLIAEHDRIRELCAAVQQAPDASLLAALALLINRHELGERAVVHPAARDSTPSAMGVGAISIAQENAILRHLAELPGSGDPTFPDSFARLHRAISEHFAYEEREEFPLMRLYLRPQRLHMMVGQLHDTQVMGVR